MNFHSKTITNFFSILILISIIIGFYEFRPPTKNVNFQFIRFLDCVQCPEWKSEMNKWEKNESHLITIWPYPRKTFNLVRN